MTRFDPRPGEPYARCLTDGCGFVADTKEQMSEHSRASMKPTGETVGTTARGHSYRVENPPRADAIQNAVQREADDALESALQEFVDSVYRLHSSDGVSLKELTEAVKFGSPSSEWSDAWAEYVAEFEDDEDDESVDNSNAQLHQETSLFDLPAEVDQ